MPAIKHVRARVHGRHLELLEDVALPANEVVNVTIELPAASQRDAFLRAFENSAGAWTDENHSELRTVDDVVQSVRDMRAGFERPHG